MLLKIRELENENAFLKSLLQKAGISYRERDNINKLTQNETFDQDLGAVIIHAEITHNIARRFFHISGAVRMFLPEDIKAKIPVKPDILPNVITSGRKAYVLRPRVKRLNALTAKTGNGLNLRLLM